MQTNTTLECGSKVRVLFYHNPELSQKGIGVIVHTQFSSYLGLPEYLVQWPNLDTVDCVAAELELVTT